MSRIGKQPILIPEGVEVKIEDDVVTVRGPKGELSQSYCPEIAVTMEDNNIIVAVQKETKKSKALWGLTRTLVANNIEGVVKGYKKKLAMIGLGYKANLEGEDLILYVGFSHPVKIQKTEGITFEVEKNIIIISGINKAKVGQVAAKIRKIKPPEPYKGKGIRYENEEVRIKVGKRAIGSGE